MTPDRDDPCLPQCCAAVIFYYFLNIICRDFLDGLMAFEKPGVDQCQCVTHIIIMYCRCVPFDLDMVRESQDIFFDEPPGK